MNMIRAVWVGCDLVAEDIQAAIPGSPAPVEKIELKVVLGMFGGVFDRLVTIFSDGERQNCRENTGPDDYQTKSVIS